MYRRLSIPLAVAMLAGLLVAFTPGDEWEAKATLGPLHSVTLNPTDFVPWEDGVDFHNTGWRMVGDGQLSARVWFPAEVVVLTSVKLYAYDNLSGPTNDVCFSLWRRMPSSPDPDEVFLGSDCTVTGTADPQKLSASAFKRVGGHHAVDLNVRLGARHEDLALYGATVFYRVVS